MPQPHSSRRFFLQATTAASALALLNRESEAAQAGPLFVYVGTFSSPLKDVLPTQVDLPPGNGRGIHIFQMDRQTGKLTPAGEVRLGTSPSCLALNAEGTQLYSANETDRVNGTKEGSVSSYEIDRTTGALKLLNTVPSGGDGPTYISIHPSRKFLLVANYFGGTVAVLPIKADGTLEKPCDVKVDSGKIGPTKAPNAKPGSFAISGHDRTHAHMIESDPPFTSGNSTPKPASSALQQLATR
jgi:6-phosphogluconolactonase (cycloisomerase 2 family)